MSKKLTTEEYIKQLIDKNIKICPLEEYKGSTIKIKHKCICGNEWFVTPVNATNNKKCGCRKIQNQLERYRNRKTILYYVKINNLWKIGITLFDKRRTVESNILKKRFKDDIRNNVKVQILKTKVFDDGSEAYLLEQKILNKYNDKLYIHKSNNMNWFGGYTELFSENIL